MDTRNLSCEDCTIHHLKQRLDTPCPTCPKPILEEGNVVAWEIYGAIASQPRIAGFGSFCGFDFSILSMLLATHGVPESDHILYLEKLLVINEVSVKISSEEERERRLMEEAKSKKRR